MPDLLEPLFPSSLHFGSHLEIPIRQPPEALRDTLPCCAPRSKPDLLQSGYRGIYVCSHHSDAKTMRASDRLQLIKGSLGPDQLLFLLQSFELIPWRKALFMSFRALGEASTDRGRSRGSH